MTNLEGQAPEVEAEARRYGATPEQAKRLGELLSKRKLPSAVRRFQLRFGEDSTSNPALWVVFFVDDDLAPSTRKIAELNDFAHEVRTDLIQQHFPFWPYVEFRAAS